MNKHFKAVHRETKEEIFFGLEDIEAGEYKVLPEGFFIGRIEINRKGIRNTFYEWLKDYEVFYQHQGVYYKYDK